MNKANKAGIVFGVDENPLIGEPGPQEFAMTFKMILVVFLGCSSLVTELVNAEMLWKASAADAQSVSISTLHPQAALTGFER